MRIASVLPHLKRFGGVRRFLELGNAFVKKGHQYELYILKRLENEATEWLDNFKGQIFEPHFTINADLMIVGDTSNPKCLELLDQASCPKKFIFVNAGGNLLPGYKKYYGKYPFILVNRIFLKDFPDSYLIEGGLNTDFWKPDNIKVGYYDQAYKGSDIVRKELGDLKHIILLPIKGMNNKELRDEYRGLDYFVSTEKRGGWGNMPAEALACGVPIISYGLNTEPFEDKVIKVKSLREFFENPMRDFSWDKVAEKILSIK